MDISSLSSAPLADWEIIVFLGETRMILLLLLIIIIIISAGIPLVSNSFHFSLNPKYIELWNQYIFVSS